MHTLTITDLDDFEAEHIATILGDYRTKIIEEKIEALCRKDERYRDWLDEHLKWHEEILTKVKWTKE